MSMGRMRLPETATSPGVVVHVGWRGRELRVYPDRWGSLLRGEDLLPAARVLAGLGNAPDWFEVVAFIERIFQYAPHAPVHEVLTHAATPSSARLATALDLAGTATTPAWVWWALALDPDGMVRKCCARGCPQHLVDGQLGEWLAGDADYAVRAVVRERCRDQSALIRWALDGGDADDLSWVARHPDASAADLAEVVDKAIGNAAVMLVLVDRVLPAELGRRIAAHGDVEVLSRMLQRLWCPGDVIDAACAHPDADIAEIAQQAQHRIQVRTESST